MFSYTKQTKLFIINLGFIKIKLTLDIEKTLIKNLKGFLALLDLVLPKQKNKIVSILYPKQENKIDPFIDWIKKNHPEYKCIRITENQDDVSKTNKTYKFYTFKALWELYRAKYIVIANSRFILDYLKSDKHTYVNFWHGMPIKTVGLTDSDTIKNKNTTKRLNFIGNKFLNFVPSDIFKHLMCSCFRAKYQNIYVTGLPVTDIIMNKEKNSNIENFFEIQKYSKIVFYLPTFKTNALCHAKQIDREYDNIFYFDNFKNSGFTEFLEKNNILFIM
ncbi:MAG: CDP-glycerol glycerophosphotransferase family protein, partial [Candidatus Gastranaerophilales bacterium]|nr:CDP-glycerol glycerophosphotransferase family protein [Candidatus Gastranaerophilales bacterium]